MNISLNFVNSAQLAPTAVLPTILIFQMQPEADGQAGALVWKVIERCRPSHFHPFAFADSASVSTGDGFGNFSALVAAGPGELFELGANGRGRRELRRRDAGNGTRHHTVSIVNGLKNTSYRACLFVRDQLIAERCALGPGDQADFSLAPVLWVGVARRAPEDALFGPRLPGVSPQVRVGDRVNDKVLETATRIDLDGVASANIVMSGDCNGLTFRREAVVWA